MVFIFLCTEYKQFMYNCFNFCRSVPKSHAVHQEYTKNYAHIVDIIVYSLQCVHKCSEIMHIKAKFYADF